MGRGGEMSKPTSPITLQPAGFVEELAGEGEPEKSAYGTTLRYEGFTPARAGEEVDDADLGDWR